MPGIRDFPSISRYSSYAKLLKTLSLSLFFFVSLRENYLNQEMKWKFTFFFLSSLTHKALVISCARSDSRTCALWCLFSLIQFEQTSSRAMESCHPPSWRSSPADKSWNNGGSATRSLAIEGWERALPSRQTDAVIWQMDLQLSNSKLTSHKYVVTLNISIIVTY